MAERRASVKKTSAKNGSGLRTATGEGEDVHDLPDSYERLDEIADTSPIENPDENQLHRHHTLEQERRQEQQDTLNRLQSKETRKDKDPQQQVSHFATELYTLSWLILFAIFGTLARLGLQALTFYPGAPVVFSELWANIGGSFVMGFLSEDRMLFRHEWGTAKFDQALQKAKAKDEENASIASVDLAAAKKTHNSTKKTIPLYIGLATGFCGSFTSFSSFIRDVFYALGNRLPTPLNHPDDYSIAISSTSTVYRDGGYSFMAVLAVIIITMSLSLSALFAGAHLALFLEPVTPSLPFRFTRRFIDPLGVFLGVGSWIGAVLLTALPPDRFSTTSLSETWRGRALFAITFAPLGCLLRFYASKYLNPVLASFPLGTFAVNMFGTAVLGMAYDLQHVPLGGVAGCQVLQGIEDGFCGCLTTVSTWVSELSALRRAHAYRYGVGSVLGGLALLVLIMGSMLWTRGFVNPVCVTG